MSGTLVTSGSASGSITLTVGANVIPVLVTAQDTSTKTYTLTVTRAAAVPGDPSASSNADLRALALSQGTLNETFAAGTTSYTASVATSVVSLTVTPTVSETTATVTVNGAAVSSGSPSGALSLSVGANTITVVVTAEDKSTKTYTLTVTRAAAQKSVDVAITQSYKLVKDSTKLTQATSLAAVSNTLTLTITVVNHGPDSADGLVIADAFPLAAAGTTWNWTCAATGGAACGAANGTGNLNETLGAMPKDGVVIFTVTGTLSNPASWRNTVAATLPSGVVNSGASATVSTVGTYRVLLPVILR